jgi:hypothetical protein
MVEVLWLLPPVQVLLLLVEESRYPLVPHQLLEEAPFPFHQEPRALIQAMEAMFQ